MKIEHSNIVRTRFIGWLITFLLLPVLLYAISSPETIKYVIGLLMPFAALAYTCLNSKKQEFSTVVSLKQARIAYSSCLMIGLVLDYTLSINYAIAWFSTAVFFVFYEPIIHDLLIMLGIHIPPSEKSGTGEE